MVVVLVTELSFYVSQQYVCDDVACTFQHSPLCNFNRTETHRGGMAENGLPVFVTVRPLLSTSVCVDLCPCSPDRRSLQYRLIYWLCSWSDVTFPLPILLLVVDIVTCCWHSCVLAAVIQLLLSLIVLVTHSRLQAMLLMWAAHYSDTVLPYIPPADLYLPLLTVNFLFRLLLWKSHCSYTYTDIQSSRTSIQSSSSDVCASVAKRLELLSIGPPQPLRESSSWLRRVEQLELLSFPSSPSHTTHLGRQLQPSSMCSPSTSAHPASPLSGSQTLLWPARLQPPRANIISATASLSLTD